MSQTADEQTVKRLYIFAGNLKGSVPAFPQNPVGPPTAAEQAVIDAHRILIETYEEENMAMFKRSLENQDKPPERMPEEFTRAYQNAELETLNADLRRYRDALPAEYIERMVLARFGEMVENAGIFDDQGAARIYDALRDQAKALKLDTIASLLDRKPAGDYFSRPHRKKWTWDEFARTAIGAEILNFPDIRRARVEGKKQATYFNIDSCPPAPFLAHVVFSGDPRHIKSAFQIDGSVNDTVTRVCFTMSNVMVMSDDHSVHACGTDYDEIRLTFSSYRNDPDHIYLNYVNMFRSKSAVPSEPGPAMDALFSRVDAIVKLLQEGHLIDFGALKQKTHEAPLPFMLTLTRHLQEEMGQIPEEVSGSRIVRYEALDRYGHDRRYRRTTLPGAQP